MAKRDRKRGSQKKPAKGRPLASHGKVQHQPARNPSDPTKKTQRSVKIKNLVENYSAHEFVIDIDEAKSLGFSVGPPDDELDRLFNNLRPFLDDLHQYVGLVPATDRNGGPS